VSTEAAISGVFAAVPTPLDESRAIDVKALDHLVDYLVERKIAGLALLTEAAEDALLAPDERRLILKTVTARLKGRRKILVSLSTPASGEAIELARQAEQKGAAGVILGPPRVPGIGYRELYRHLDRVARAVTIPVLLLARPGNALDALLPEELEAIAGHGSLKGVHAPHASAAQIEAWAKRLKGKGAAVLGGSSLTASRLVRAGATGVVCAMATVAADTASELWSAVGAQDKATIDRIEGQVAAVVEALGPPIVGETKDGVAKLATKIAKRSLESAALAPSYPFALIKETLKLQGHPVRGDVRAPYESPRPEVIERLKALLARGGVLP
jgi:4-hydroxy-tetrahydrodipicolinate synthase